MKNPRCDECRWWMQDEYQQNTKLGSGLWGECRLQSVEHDKKADSFCRHWYSRKSWLERND